MSATPLSDLIRKFHQTRSREDFDAVVELCVRAPIGIVAVGVQPKAHEDVTIASDGNISLGNTTHGDGVSRLIAFADPREFRARFGNNKCNGEMLGAELFKTALHNHECAGVLLNCATEEISVPIPRSDIEDAIENLAPRSRQLHDVMEEVPPKRKWWQVWW
ncbi:hypothetical protein QRD43_01825 [Pelomonas sp. APW6]|uniref:DUF4253 domain-containing protein n=1 Tax=Roseateles subflavus TaxID=3053353 RepID=A0ABT7LG46_9BURK|nr:SseB family protein [Pelomonas sp. APW6]MDL5030630.1 hypothetical protein [Pelomonas sp. APW6]